MNRYINADLIRIFRRLPRYIVLAVLFAATFFIVGSMAENKTIYEFISSFTSVVNALFVFLGLVEYSFVYSDDFKAKTMQIAIGTGISRRRVILSKWAEIAILTFIDLIITAVLVIVAVTLKGVSFTPDILGSFFILLFFGMIKVIGSIGFTMILVFFTQNTSVGMLVYLAFASEIIDKLLSSLLDAEFLKSLHISGYTFSGLLQLSRARLMLGHFHFGYNIGIVLYLFLFYFLACLLFRKRELEF